MKDYDVTCATGLNIVMSRVTLNFTSVPNLLSTICHTNWLSNTTTESRFSYVHRNASRSELKLELILNTEHSQALKRHKVFEMEVLPNNLAADYTNITHLTYSLKDLRTGIASSTYFMVI